MKNSKNQINRTIKSYETGGSSDDSCMETVMVDGKPKRRKKSKCGQTKTFRVRSTADKVKLGAKVAGVAGVVVGGLAANKKYGLIAKLKEKLNLKKGGQVKTKLTKKALGGYPPPLAPPIKSTIKKPCPPGYRWDGTNCVIIEKNMYQQLRKYPKDKGTVPPPSVFDPLTKKEIRKKERMEKKDVKNKERNEKKDVKINKNVFRMAKKVLGSKP